MSSKDVLEQALKLNPDSALDAIWTVEAEKRLNAYRSDDLEGIPMEEIFKEE